MAVTDDGRQIYFTTTLVQRSAADGPVENRVYRLDAGGLTLYNERGELANQGGFGSGDGAASLHVSGDGQSVAFIQHNICESQPCTRSMSRAEIRGRYAGVFGEAERILLSRNGRWALVVPPRFGFRLPGQPPTENTDSTLVNLETGARTSVMARPATSDEYFALASDGSVLVQSGIWRDGQVRPLSGITGAGQFSTLR